MKLISHLATIDVTRGRVTLRREINRRLKHLNQYERLVGQARIPVIIHGFIDDIWGNDDGESQEFEVAVTKVEVTL